MEVRGEPAVANGWFQRAQRLLEPLPPAPEHGLLGVFMAYGALDEDPAAAAAHAAAAVSMAEATGAADIGTLARALHGLALVRGPEVHVTRGSGVFAKPARFLSNSERDGVRLFAVVLGSTARELRFVDTELICNWAWAKLQAEPQR